MSWTFPVGLCVALCGLLGAVVLDVRLGWLTLLGVLVASLEGPGSEDGNEGA